MRIRIGADTHVGQKREVNQDYYGLGNQEQSEQRGYLLVVCDGMGGHTAGEVASRLAVETILDQYYQSESQNHVDALEQAFYQANHRVYEEGEGSMGTTGVASLFLNNRLHTVNVGDSRAYLIRNGDLEQITRDHSLVAEQVAAGLITSEQARHSNYRNMITRALGYRPVVDADPFTLSVQVGDILVLSTDGLHGLVEDDEIGQVVSTLEPQKAVQRLISMANDRGGVDNITVVVAIVDELDEPGESAETDASTAETTLLASSPNDETTQPGAHPAAATIELPETRAEKTLPQDAAPEPSPVPRLPLPLIGVAGGILVVLFIILGVSAFNSNEPAEPAGVSRSTPTPQNTPSPTTNLSTTDTLSTTTTYTPTASTRPDRTPRPQQTRTATPSATRTPPDPSPESST